MIGEFSTIGEIPRNIWLDTCPPSGSVPLDRSAVGSRPGSQEGDL